MRYYWMGRSYIKYTILLGRPTHIIYDITGSRKCNMRYYWVGPLHLIYNMQYYWVGLPNPIYNITGSAHLLDMQYAILLGGPTKPNIQYYWVSPPTGYAIRDITGWAYQTQYTRLLGQPTYLAIQYAILLGGPLHLICDTTGFDLLPGYATYNITRRAHLIFC
jgi:hypothetical protein